MEVQNAFSLLSSLENVIGTAPPPLDQWQPEIVTEIDMVIKKSGEWLYQGSEIKRPRLVRLFSSVLRLERDGHYYLVTPVEKCRITVEDTPFIAILLDVAQEKGSQILTITTNVGDSKQICEPLDLQMRRYDGQLVPYVAMRDGLDARCNRNVYYQLAELVVEEKTAAMTKLGVWSQDHFYDFSGDEPLSGMVD